MWDSQQITQLTKSHEANTGLSGPDTLNTAYESHHHHQKQKLSQRPWSSRPMNDSSQMRFPRDNTGLDTIIHGSSKILFDERYRWKFLESVF